MQGSTPRKAFDCTHCHVYSGIKFVQYKYCSDHPEGQDYAGPDLYEPSEFVQETVGKFYSGPFGEHVFKCTGYDRRAGFWMRNIANPMDLHNVSERAIGRTYHRLRSLDPAPELLDMQTLDGWQTSGKRRSVKSYPKHSRRKGTTFYVALSDTSAQSIEGNVFRTFTGSDLPEARSKAAAAVRAKEV